MSFVAESVWTDLKTQLCRRIPEVLFEQWFARAEIVSCDDSCLELGVQNRFFKSRIEAKYLPVLKEAAEEALGRPMRVTVSVSPRLLAAFRKSQAEASAEADRLSVPALIPAKPTRVEKTEVGLGLDPDFTFERFVAGASNRLSHAVALHAVENPEGFDRVFFCGGHGVGKTHLLQAICHRERELRPESRVAYVTCDRFMADYTSAHALGKLKAFRAAYRALDVLAFDEAQNLGVGNKAGTQAELLGIVDELAAGGRRVIVGATMDPESLEGVDPKLRDRFRAGFVDRLAVPDEGTRRELIARKLGERGLELPGEAVDLMARELTGNVRKLEGTVLRLAALIQLEGMEPTTGCIRMALRVSAPTARPAALTYGDVVAAVAEEYGLTAEALTGRGRAGVVRAARQLAMVLCRRLVGGRYADVGAVFGGRSHATVISAVKGFNPAIFADGLEARPVERILFRLGLNIKPEQLSSGQKTLF